MQKLLKIYLLLIVFPFTGYAQQLIYNQSFENIISITYPYTSLSGRWYEYNQVTSTVNTICNMNTHTHAFCYSVDTVSKNKGSIAILRTNADPLSGQMGYSAPEGTKFLVIEKRNQKSFNPRYYINALISGISSETKATLQQGNYYFCRFYSFSDTSYVTKLNSTPGLLVGVSSSQDNFGNTIAHIYTPLGLLHPSVSHGIPRKKWTKNV